MSTKGRPTWSEDTLKAMVSQVRPKITISLKAANDIFDRVAYKSICTEILRVRKRFATNTGYVGEEYAWHAVLETIRWMYESDEVRSPTDVPLYKNVYSFIASQHKTYSENVRSNMLRYIQRCIEHGLTKMTIPCYPPATIRFFLTVATMQVAEGLKNDGTYTKWKAQKKQAAKQLNS